MKAADHSAKILLYDIETSPIVGAVWGMWQQDVAYIFEDWQILTVAWKWLGEKAQVKGQDDFKDFKPGKLNDKNLVRLLHSLFDEADIVIAHNGNQFDQKKVVARMQVHGITPPSPYFQVDTKVEMKKVAAHTSNKLADLNRSLGIQSKLDSGGILTWILAMEGDKKAFARMKKYNIGDVRALEELYLLERPWMTSHPNIALINGTPESCHKCGSFSIQKRGIRWKNTQPYHRTWCSNCKTWGRTRQSIKDLPKPLYVS